MPRAPLDTAFVRPSTADVGDSPLHGAAFDKDLHRTPAVLWVQVPLLCLGAAIGGRNSIMTSVA